MRGRQGATLIVLAALVSLVAPGAYAGEQQNQGLMPSDGQSFYQRTTSLQNSQAEAQPALTEAKNRARELRPHWELVPEIAVKEVYTDNVNIAPPGQERSDFVTELTPGLAVHEKSRRLRLDLNYQLQSLLYANESSHNTVNQLVQLSSTGEVLSHHAFIDFNLRSSPQNVSNIGTIPVDNISISPNRRTVTTYSVSPYWRQHFSSFADLETRYTYSQLTTASGFGLNSQSNTVEAHLKSGDRFTRLLWKVDYSRQHVTYSAASSSQLEYAVAQAQYLITPHIGLLAGGGFDSNDYGAGVPGKTAARWDIGASWRPDSRNSLEAKVGERFFGTTYSFDLKHHTRRTDWIASYTEEPTTVRDVLLEQQVFPVLDGFGNPIINPGTGQPLELNVNVPTPITGVVVLKRFSTLLRYVAARWTLELHGFDENRDYQVTNQTESAKGADASFIYALGPRTSANLNAGWSRNHLRGGRRYDYMHGQLSVTRKLARQLSATLAYRYIKINSNSASDQYSENRAWIYLDKTF